ncbi:hypothetical protein Hanom_Chr06g00505361 [Helianthus anomalus]
MVLRTERCRCPCSSSQQQCYSTYQESGCTHTAPYSQNHQSGWSNVGGYYGNNGPIHPPPVGQVTTILPNNGSYYHGQNSYGNGMNYGYQQTTWIQKNLDNE